MYNRHFEAFSFQAINSIHLFTLCGQFLVYLLLSYISYFCNLRIPVYCSLLFNKKLILFLIYMYIKTNYSKKKIFIKYYITIIIDMCW